MASEWGVDVVGVSAVHKQSIGAVYAFNIQDEIQNLHLELKIGYIFNLVKLERELGRASEGQKYS